MSDLKIKKQNKNPSIQILRAVAIIAVVIIHSYPQGLFGVFLRPFVNFAVALFLFLSGYLTKFEIPDYKRFVLKRTLKVIIPYCIWSFIYTIPRGFDNFLIRLVTGRCCSIYYYIFVYIQFVILTPLIVKLIKSKYRILGWFITPVSSIVFIYIFKMSDLSILNFVGENYKFLFIAWFIFYYFGLILGNNVITIKQNKLLHIGVYAATIMVSLVEGLVWYKKGNYGMATSQLRLTTIGTSMAFLILAYFFIKNCPAFPKTANKILVTIGNTSFGVYLSHLVIMDILATLPFWQYFVFPLNSIIVLAVSVIIVLIVNKILPKFSWILGF